MNENRKKTMQELQRLDLAEYKSASKVPVVLVLDNIRSLHNVGSAFRTADAFRIEKIILSGITASPPHREIQKTALGATESVDWEYQKDAKETILALKKQNYTIIAVEQCQNSIELQEYKSDKQEKTVLIFGNEVEGVSDELLNVSDLQLEIPQIGTKHSLNISVSIGIVFWHLLAEKISTFLNSRKARKEHINSEIRQ
jgi:23S rRNA (guanosine2251-2'-O)-methyltransferase